MLRLLVSPSIAMLRAWRQGNRRRLANYQPSPPPQHTHTHILTQLPCLHLAMATAARWTVCQTFGGGWVCAASSVVGARSGHGRAP